MRMTPNTVHSNHVESPYLFEHFLVVEHVETLAWSFLCSTEATPGHMPLPRRECAGRMQTIGQLS